MNKLPTSSNVTDRPARRPLKILAGDPMLGRIDGNHLVVEVPNEILTRGPVGSRLAVVDYDGTHKRFYRPVDLDDRHILMQRGLEPAESDPRFHQQMVYAVGMKTLENFDRALGRTVQFSRPLRMFPHAFHGANAFYSEALHAVLFGYFRADLNEPGRNLPGQTVFTCLSHDIIVHEVTHAIVHRLREYFREPTNPDVLAFHEGFSDIVALFQHFTFQDLLRSQIQTTRTDLRRRTLLVELAQQFGYATGRGRALRSALEEPDPSRYRTVFEAHDRGSILVGTVFDAFFEGYQRRIRDLVRIATGGTGNLPDADLHPDLVNRIASEAAKTAQIVLTMCIRAFDYLPPVDVTFGDFLRAMVTADYELFPEDSLGQRGAMIEAFRKRGIYPTQVASLAEESLLWETPKGLALSMEGLVPAFAAAAMGFNRDRRAVSLKKRAVAVGLHQFAMRNREVLRLDPHRPVAVRAFTPVFRVGPDGALVVELVAQLVQTDENYESELGGIPLRGGTTIIVAGDGRIRYAIAKPIKRLRGRKSGRRGVDERDGDARYAAQLRYLNASDAADPRMVYEGGEYRLTRSLARMSLASLHGGFS